MPLLEKGGGLGLVITKRNLPCLKKIIYSNQNGVQRMCVFYHFGIDQGFNYAQITWESRLLGFDIHIQ